jgi:hypothetical protein
MPLILPGNVGSATAATGFDVANSCRFDGASSSMKITPGSNMNLLLITWSGWIKRSGLGTVQSIFAADNAVNSTGTLYFDANDKLNFQNVSGNADKGLKITTRVFRDPSAWMHLVWAWDSANSTAGDRIKIYVNGVRETVFDSSTNPDVNEPSQLGESGVATLIGTYVGEDSRFWNGYMAEVVLIDGAALAADQFGEFDDDSGIWKPIDVSGLTFGTHGFYLDFEASDNLGNDANGGTDLTESGLAATDQSTDTCTNNFATFNPLTTIDASLIKEGNLFPELATADESVVSTIAMTSGKWYWEAKVTDQGSRGYHGITSYTVPQIGGNAPRISGFSFAVAFGHDGTTGAGVGTVNSNFKGSAIANDEILTFCFDADNGQIWIDINAVDISGTATVTGLTTGIPYFAFFEESGSNTDRTDVKYNFGSPIVALSSANADGEGFGSFEYAPPSGYFALCTKNLAEYG